MDMQLDKIREFFSNDKYATMSGAVVEKAGQCSAECSLEITDLHRNAMGGVMGAVYFTLADFTFAVASNAYMDEPDVVAVSGSISYLNACKGSKLIAKAVCTKEGRTTCNYIVTVSDDTGRDVATVMFVGCHTKRR